MEEFAERWLGPHCDLAAQLEGLRGYRVNLVVSKPDDVPWDGFGESWFDSLEAEAAAFAAEPLGSALKKDREKFASEVKTFYAEERVVVARTPEA